MHGRVFILFAAWIAVAVAFSFGHPIAYTVIVIGLATSVAIAAEDLLEADPAVSPGRVTRPAHGQPGIARPGMRVTRIPVAVAHSSHRQPASAAATVSS
jgi:hypothetical protein